MFSFLFYPIQMLQKYIFNPKHFQLGSEIEHISFNYEEQYVIKTFKMDKIDKMNKAIQFSKIFRNVDFFPKLLNYNISNRILQQEYVGVLVNIKYNLPVDWIQQLYNIKNFLIRVGYHPGDLDIWDLNPYIVNNLCVKNDKLYLIDFGDFKKDTSENINTFFEDLEEKIIWNQKQFLIILIFYHIYVLIGKLFNSLRKRIY